MDASAHFRGKKITLMRIGLLGRGVGDAAYLAECGADVLVVDAAPQEVMQPSVDALKKYPNIRFKFGSYDLADFTACDLVLKGAGTPLASPEIREAKRHGIPVRMSADLFMEYAGIPVAGVTGTRGKSTVTHMIYEILKTNYELGLHRSEGAVGRTGLPGKPVLGGNVRGVSTLALLKEVPALYAPPASGGASGEHPAKQDVLAVLELDSWQCQGLGEANLSPHVAVFTTFFQDHLNYYADDPGQYLADKANIFLYQSPDDTLVLGKQCAPILIEAFGEHIVAKTVVADESKLPADWKLRIPGSHNRYDAALALSAARAFGVDDAVSKKALEGFAGVSGRLEFLGERGGVKIYNDNNATTPEATLAALDALGTQRTILIMGGADKGLDMSALLARLPEVKKVILLSGTGTTRIRSQVPEDAQEFASLAEAVSAGLRVAEPGDTVLFSPAFASFGMFKNEYDRNDRLVALVSGYE